jgi:hypothetical protein
MAYRKPSPGAHCRPHPHHAGDHRPARGRHQAVDPALARRPGVAALARLRDSLSRHERVLAVDGRRHVRLRLALLDDLQPGPRPRRAGPQGREVDHRHLLQELHQGGRSARYRREERRSPPRAEGLSGLQRRPGRGSARALPSLPPRSNWSSPKAARLELDAFFAAIPVNLRHQGDEAYYEPTADRVTMPPAHPVFRLRPLLRDACPRAVAAMKSCRDQGSGIENLNSSARSFLLAVANWRRMRSAAAPAAACSPAVVAPA